MENKKISLIDLLTKADEASSGSGEAMPWREKENDKSHFSDLGFSKDGISEDKVEMAKEEWDLFLALWMVLFLML